MEIKIRLEPEEIKKLLIEGNIKKNNIEINCSGKPIAFISKIYDSIIKLTNSQDYMKSLYGSFPERQVNICDLDTKSKKKGGKQNARKTKK